MSKQDTINQLFNTFGQLKKLLENQTQEPKEEKTATMMQYSALMFLKDNTHATVGDLASRLILSKSSATQLVERLVKSGLAERVSDESDRRLVRIVITPSGEEQYLSLKKAYMEKLGKVFSKIPEEDLKELIRVHTKLIETLQ